MRSFITGLFILMLSLSPSLAQGQCREIITPESARVGDATPGFEPVLVYVEVPVEKGEVEAEARKAFVRFWMAGNDSRVRIDARRDIYSIHRCTFTFKQGDIVERTDKMYFRLRMLAVHELNTETSYALRSGIFLPKSLVAKRPRAETELDSGEILHGVWDSVKITRPVEVFAKTKKGKRTVKVVEKTVMVARLVLRLK